MISPRLIIYFLAFSIPLQIYLNIGSLPISTAYLLIVIAALLFLVTRSLSGNWKLYFPKELLPIGIFVLVIIFSFINANDLGASLILGVQIAAYVILFFVSINVLNTQQHVYKVIYFLLIGTIISAIIGISQVWIGTKSPQTIVNLFFRSPFANLFLGSRNLLRLGDFGLQGPDILYRGNSLEGIGNLFRAFGLFEGPTIYGWFSATVAVFAIGFWLVKVNSAHELRRIAGLGAILGSAAVLLSWTRSAWLALIVGASFILVFRQAKMINRLTKRWILLTTFLIFALGTIILTGYLFPTSIFGRMVLSAIGGPEAVGSNNMRLTTARFALNYLLSHPVVGVGFGNYSYLVSGTTAATALTAHNTFLELGVELGLPGLILFVWLLIVAFSGSNFLIRQPVGSLWHALGISLFGVWISYIVILMFGGNIIHPKWMTCWWLLLGLQVAARRVITRFNE